MLLPDPDGTVHGELDAGAGARGCATGGPGSAPTACSAWSAPSSYDDPAAVAARGEAEWFMDYRNADGSTSEMCGNGIRVFGRYLVDHEGADPSRPLPIGTRAGVQDADLRRRRRGHRRHGQAAGARGDQGRRSAAVRLAGDARVDGQPARGRLRRVPRRRRPAARGARTRRDGLPRTASTSSSSYAGAARHVAMRVHERGSGETRSCGTGACAVMVAAALADGAGRGYDLPGGRARRHAARDLDRRGPRPAHRPRRPGRARVIGWWPTTFPCEPERTYDERTHATRRLRPRRRARRHRDLGRPRRPGRQASSSPATRTSDPEEAAGTTGDYDLAERHALRRVAGLSHRARGHHRGRVPPAPPGAGRPGRRLDRGLRRGRRELHGRARAARRDRRLAGARRAVPAPAEARPGDLHRSRQGRRAPRDRAGHRRRHRDLRRRARSRAAEEPRGPGQGQGRRPDRADPRHLRPAREVAGGPGAGRARPAQLHEAAAAWLGWQPLPPGRWPGRLAGRRHRWSWSR